MKVEKFVVGCELPVVRTVGRKYSTEMVVGEWQTFLIKGQSKQCWGFIREIDLDSMTFVQEFGKRLTRYNIADIRMMCV